MNIAQDFCYSFARQSATMAPFLSCSDCRRKTDWDNKFQVRETALLGDNVLQRTAYRVLHLYMGDDNKHTVPQTLSLVWACNSYSAYFEEATAFLRAAF